jgi:hypothetical protein
MIELGKQQGRKRRICPCDGKADHSMPLLSANFANGREFMGPGTLEMADWLAGNDYRANSSPNQLPCPFLYIKIIGDATGGGQIIGRTTGMAKGFAPVGAHLSARAKLPGPAHGYGETRR